MMSSIPLRMIVLPLVLFFLNAPSNAQTISGQVMGEDHTKLSYVNIGILGTSTGTVSDEHGKFELFLNDNPLDSDTLCVSIIGYKSQYFRLKNIKSPLFVTLEQENIVLDEIVVMPEFSTQKVKGNKMERGLMRVNFSIANKPRQNLGAEIGKKFRVKKNKRTHVQSLRFFVHSNNFKEVKFRALFYSVKKGKPDKYLTNHDIICTLNDQQRGWVEVDLTEYRIMTEHNFIASIEWIDASSEGSLLALPINMPLPGGHHYYKFGSQAKWKHFRNMSSSMNVTLAY